jgi:bifunctional UDP-N-acetylglucosamine pyrophosphorylase/glucosamine-1-phosphate N-acetyltransferase
VDAPVAIVLAAGESTRLWPLRDKALVRLCGSTLLEEHLSLLARAGFVDAVIVCSADNEAGIRAIRPSAPMNLSYVRQAGGRPGMGGAILSACDGIAGRGARRAAYVTQAHDVVSRDLHRQVLTAWLEGGRSGLLVGWQLPEGDYFPGGYLLLGPARSTRERAPVIGILEKPGPDRIPDGRLVTIVAHVHPDIAALCRAIETEYETGGADDHYERAVSRLMTQVPYHAFIYDGPWHPLKYPWHLLAITRYRLGDLMDVDDRGADVSPGASIEGPVHLGVGARVLWGAHVKGPAWIGNGALIGQFAQIRDSYVGDNAIVGVHSEVNRSYIGDRAELHAARVLDSVVAQTPIGDPPPNIAAGVITANLRTDHGSIRSAIKGERIDTGLVKFGAVIGSGAFISIQAGLMPGVKVGERAVVLPGAIIYRDVPDDARVTAHSAERSNES